MEIWRLGSISTTLLIYIIITTFYFKAILYAWGGMYMDDDANFGTNLDNVIQETDKLILGINLYKYRKI